MSYSSFRNIASFLCLPLAMATPAAVFAQAYPAKVVRIINPFTPGGGADNIGRLLAEKLQPVLKQSFIVENKPGAGGNIAHEYVAKAAPDGYTLMITTNALTINDALYEKLPFSASKSFTPIILAATSPLVIGGSAKLPVSTVPELIAYAKKQSVSYASCGNGSPHQLAAELLNSAAGIKLVHIPYKGCSQAIPDVLGGQVETYVNSLPNVIGHARSGKLKLYAIMASKRSPSVPDIPTVAEAAQLPEVQVDGWYGVLGPPKLPRDIVATLNSATNAILASNDAKARLRDQYYDVQGGTPEDFAQLIGRDVAVYSKIIKAAKIRPE